MKKLIFAMVTFVLLFVCAVSASAAETPVRMEITAHPDKLIYSAEDAVKRTESVFVADTQSITTTTYDYYPLSFEGLEITFTYADASTKVFVFDDVLSLVSEDFVIQNKTVQNANNQWQTDSVYDVVLACGDLQVSWQIAVTAQMPETDAGVTDIRVVRMPEKRVYVETEKISSSGFNENGEAVQYDSFLLDLQGLMVCIQFADGSFVYCSPAMMTALTGIQMQVDDKQTVSAPWKLGKNTIQLTFGSFTEELQLYLDVEGHRFDAYSYVGDDTHTGNCLYCEQTISFACEGGSATCAEQAVCVRCGASYGNTLPHDIRYTTAAKTHTELCRNCDYKNENIPHQMTAGAYEEDRKSALYTCTICGCAVYAQAMGDVDESGGITAADARDALRFAVSLTSLSERRKLLADVDGDGVVTAADARIILRACVSLEPLDDYLPVNSES